MTSAKLKSKAVCVRAMVQITNNDLERLAKLTLADQADFTSRLKQWQFLRRRLLCVTLCQGAALHYLDRVTGIKDFDVWTFYELRPGERRFPERKRPRKQFRDFGPSKFGRHPTHACMGRRVDMFGRSIRGRNPIKAVRLWLSTGLQRVKNMSPQRRAILRRNGKLPSPYCLALKAVIAIYPRSLRGTVIWGQQDRPAKPPIQCK